MRNPNDKLLTNIEMKINKFIKRLCKKENVNFKINKIVNFKSVNFDNKMNQIIKKHSDNLNYSNMYIHSGAGHDAQMLAQICPTTMIFIPSQKGISHHSKEYTKNIDLIKGVNLLYKVTKDLISN